MADALHRVPPDWREWLPWLLLLQTLKLAKELPKLLLGGLGLLATAAGWQLLGAVFGGSRDVTSVMERFCTWPWQDNPVGVSSGVAASGTLWVREATGFGQAGSPAELSWLARNPLVESWELFCRPVRGLFAGGVSVTECAFLLLCTAWAAAVWAIFGGAISRIAAVQLARQERVSLREAVSYARGRWSQYFWAPLMPLTVVFGLAALMSSASWLLRFDLGLLAAALAWPLWLGAGMAMAVVGLGLIFGWPLMTPTISSEGTDSFDAVSRSFAYVYQRPLHYLGYAVVAMVHGVFGWLLVSAMAAAAVYLAWWGASFAGGAERTAQIASAIPHQAVMIAWAAPSDLAGGQPAGAEPASAGGAGLATGDAVPKETGQRSALSATARWGVAVLTFWLTVVKLLALGFGPSYFWTSMTATYLLLRRDTDQAELDEVWMPASSAATALPKLAVDAAGVPVVAGEDSERFTQTDLLVTETVRTGDLAPSAVPGAGAIADRPAPPRTAADAEFDLTESRAEYDGG